MKQESPKAIIIGASSGIGKELAFILAKEGYTIGITARRLDLLNNIKQEINSNIYIKQMDVSSQIEAMSILNQLIDEMDGIDLIIICAGIGYINNNLDWDKEQETININVTGFSAIVNVALKFFLKRGSGHIVGISSIAAIRGNGEAPAYNASKAFVSNYLDGLRYKCSKLNVPITITDIQPGLIDTDMAKGEGLFWVSSPYKAAKQIYNAIKKKKKHIYITKRWRLIAYLLKIMPDQVYYKL